MGGVDDSETAARVAAHLEAIRSSLRASTSAAVRDYPVALTAPQALALEVLAAEARVGNEGVSLSQLSRRMGLAHSTASGIVDRLEKRGLLRRSTHAEDRRYTQIELSAEASAWVERELPGARVRPIEAALGAASDAQRAAILRGLRTLEKLLADDAAS